MAKTRIPKALQETFSWMRQQVRSQILEAQEGYRSDFRKDPAATTLKKVAEEFTAASRAKVSSEHRYKAAWREVVKVWAQRGRHRLFGVRVDPRIALSLNEEGFIQDFNAMLKDLSPRKRKAYEGLVVNAPKVDLTVLALVGRHDARLHELFVKHATAGFNVEINFTGSAEESAEED